MRDIVGEVNRMNEDMGIFEDYEDMDDSFEDITDEDPNGNCGDWDDEVLCGFLDDAYERNHEPSPKYRAKRSLTLNGMRHAFNKGQRKFWVASHEFQACDPIHVVLFGLLPDEGSEYARANPNGWFAHKDDEDSEYTHSSSVLDRNLLRLNGYNDWFVFRHESEAKRFVKRGW